MVSNRKPRRASNSSIPSYAQFRHSPLEGPPRAQTQIGDDAARPPLRRARSADRWDKRQQKRRILCRVCGAEVAVEHSTNDPVFLPQRHKNCDPLRSVVQFARVRLRKPSSNNNKYCGHEQIIQAADEYPNRQDGPSTLETTFPTKAEVLSEYRGRGAPMRSRTPAIPDQNKVTYCTRNPFSRSDFDRSV